MLSTPASLLYKLRVSPETALWDRFVELYSPLLFHWARRRGEQNSDAADLVQDVFLLLWQKLPQFEYDPSRSFHAWLRTLFLNCARQRARKCAPITADDAFDDLAGAAADDALEEQEYRHYLLHRAFQLIRREFSPQHAAAFERYALAGRPVDEVAREFNLSTGTIYSVKSRILNRLRQELAGLMD